MPPEIQYQYKTIRTPSWVINKWKAMYPGHDIAFRQRTNPLTKVSHFQPYCVCKGWRSDRWFAHKTGITERTYVQEHIAKVHKQGHLFDTVKDSQAQVAYHADDWNKSDRIHDYTL